MDVECVQKLFDALLNYINKVVITYQNTSQLFYFCMKVPLTRINFETLEQKHVN